MIGETHALGGALVVNSGAVFLLDRLGNVPIEPLPSIVPGVTPSRSTWDVVQSENYARNYRVTTNAIQSANDTTTHVVPELRTLTIDGLITNDLSLQFGTGVPIVPGTRLDVFRAYQFEELAKKRALVMVVTPRVTLHRAFITGIQRPWSPADGESTRIAISFIEARLVSPLAGADVLPDDPAFENGNLRDTGGGGQAGQNVGTVNAQPAGPGAPPLLVGGFA